MRFECILRCSESKANLVLVLLNQRILLAGTLSHPIAMGTLSSYRFESVTIVKCHKQLIWEIFYGKSGHFRCVTVGTFYPTLKIEKERKKERTHQNEYK